MYHLKHIKNMIQPKSICCVSQSFLPYVGGLTRYVNALGKQLVKDGYDFRVFHFKTSNIGAVDFSTGMQLIRINIDDLGNDTLESYMGFKEMLLNATHGFQQESSSIEGIKKKWFDGYLRVNERIHEYIYDSYEYKPFDILHIHDFQLLPFSTIGKKLKVSTIFTWHIPFTMEMDAAWREFIITYMKHYDKIVFSNEEYVKAAITSGLASEKALCIYPFIDPSDYTIEGENDVRKRFGIREDEILILCVSRIDPRKGQEVLIKAMKKVVEEIPSAKCIFVGNGSFSQELMKKERSERHKKLLGMVEELGLTANVVFTGLLSDNDVCKFYAASDIVVQPSLHEGFGLTVTEGMLFSKPVIGSRVGGLEAQINWRNGYLFKPGDSDELSEKIIILAQDKELREKMGAKGKEFVQKLKGGL